MKIVIVGIGSIGLELAENLARRHGNQLVLIDIDDKRCEHLGNSIDALVLCGDGANPDILKKARVAEADALVAATDSDSTNTVIAILGHRIGVKKIMVRLNDVGLRAACIEIGVTKIVMPKISAAAELLGALYGFDRLDISLLMRYGLRLVEIPAGKAAGKRLSEVELPDGALVVAVMRGEQVFVPNKRTKIEEEDVFFTLVENEDIMEKSKKYLSE
jgi:trk system potassium uptake protein